MTNTTKRFKRTKKSLIVIFLRLSMILKHIKSSKEVHKLYTLSIHKRTPDDVLFHILSASKIIFQLFMREMLHHFVPLYC